MTRLCFVLLCFILTAQKVVCAISPVLRSEAGVIDGDGTAFYENLTSISSSFFVLTDGSTDEGGFLLADSSTSNTELNTFFSITNTRQKTAAVLYGFPLGGSNVDLVVALGGGDVLFYALKVDEATRTLVDVTAEEYKGPLALETLCAYKSPVYGLFYAFTLSDGGLIQQWHVYESSGKVAFGLVRSWNSGLNKPHGCAIDEAAKTLFVCDDDGGGIMKYKTEYDESTTGEQVQSLSETDGELPSMALYRSDPTTNGYIIVFNKDSQKLVLLTRAEPHNLVGVVETSNQLEDLSGMIAIETNLGGVFDDGVLIFYGEDADGESYMAYSWKDVIADLNQNYTKTFTSQRYDFCNGTCAPLTCPSVSECSNQGSCLNSTHCVCYGGWSGASCSNFTCSDLNNCNSNGKCIGPNNCECNNGFSGDACEFYVVFPLIETDPAGTDADDPAFWVHPTIPSQSVLIGTTKSSGDSGLHVYDLNGTQIQFVETEEPNSVDVIYSFSWGGVFVDLVFAGLRGTNELGFWKMNRNTRKLEEISGGRHAISFEIYGTCYYRSKAGDFYAIVNNKDAEFRQYKLSLTNGTLNITLVRSFTNGDGSQPEGCVGDNELGWLYTGEEAVGVWKYGAEPDWNEEPTLIGSTDISDGGVLRRDVEGMSIFYGKNGQGYLVVSTQGINGYAVFNRSDDQYLFSFQINANTNAGIDGVTQTDGLDVISSSLGPSFPFGALAVHDDTNTFPNGTSAPYSSFKLVSWESLHIIKSLENIIDVNPTWNPRLPSDVPPTSAPTSGPTISPTSTPTEATANQATVSLFVFIISLATYFIV